MRPAMLAATLLLAAALTAGCGAGRRGGALLRPAGDAPPRIAPQAGEALATLQAYNAGLAAFKGLGRVRIVEGARRQSLRIAWLAALPDRMRIEILGPYGRPAASLASDGRILTLRDYATARFHRAPLTESGALRDLIPIDLQPRELLALLAGRVALLPFDQAEAEALGEEGATWLRLRHSGSGTDQRIALAPGGGGRVAKVEVRDPDGRLRYAAQLHGELHAGRFVLPAELALQGPEGAGLTLGAETVWDNPAFDGDRFVLSAPVEDGSGSGPDRHAAGR
jgi:hypothetical protein